MSQTENRKDDHIKISLDENVQFNHNYWDDVKLIHNALPEINMEDITINTELFGKKLGAPIIVASMTGGYKKAKEINENLASAAEKYQLGMGVGSQRAAIENPSLAETYSAIKNYNIPLKFANIGASQLVLWGPKKTLQNAKIIVEMIDADVLFVCLNFLQEAVQWEGEPHAKGCLKAITKLAENLDTPIVVKESGAGIGYNVAEKLYGAGIAGIDVGGAGGTSFAAIEHYRAKMKNDKLNERSGKTFWEWGIPTPTCIMEVGDATNWELPIIATGGIRNGLDIAKALSIGAKATGIAHTLLKPATQSKNDTITEVETIIKELKAAMFLLGIDNIQKMSDTGVDLWI
jgi:isopentenyl-diphosphate delta-isomerase